MTTSKWRLLIDKPAHGAWNMAVDEAILEATRDGHVLPTLRLYAWEPACLSLGYAQSYRDVFEEALFEHGWEVVRRPTGGRAILHTDELTYSVTGTQSEPRLEGSVLESYRRLSIAMVDALHQLGVPAEIAPPKLHSTNLTDARTALKGPVCFEVPSDYEIVVEGKKLIGSAQARRKGGVLQHGSLPLYGDLRRIVQALVFPSDTERIDAGERLLTRATTVESVLGFPMDWEQAANAFWQSFESVLEIEFLEDSLTPQENSRAQELMKEKYGHDSWNKGN